MSDREKRQRDCDAELAKGLDEIRREWERDGGVDAEEFFRQLEQQEE